MRAEALVAVLVAPMLLAGCLDGGQEGGSGLAAVPPAGPDWSFVDTRGETHDRERYAGAPVVLFVMATWCSSCRAEAPRVLEAHESLAGENVTFLSVSIDPSESQEALHAWQEEHGHAWPHGVDAGGSVTRAFDVRVQSTVVVLDGSGRVTLHAYSPSAEAIVDAVKGAR